MCLPADILIVRKAKLLVHSVIIKLFRRVSTISKHSVLVWISWIQIECAHHHDHFGLDLSQRLPSLELENRWE